MKSNIKLSKFLAASSIAITPGTTTPAKSAPFNDQFFHADGAVNGTVQRLITLPDGDGTFAASALSLTSFSPDLQNRLEGPGSCPDLQAGGCCDEALVFVGVASDQPPPRCGWSRQLLGEEEITWRRR
ncbi:MAG: hypothetical protein RLZZ117_1240 [Cyanobacteriota bacterium]|jgi:hypothetical protein